MPFSKLRISDSLSPVTANTISNPCKQNTTDAALTSLALIPVHNQRPFECVPIGLQSPQGVRLILGTLNDPAHRTRSTQVLQDVLELVGRGRCLCDIELELCALGLVLGVVAASLVFGGSCGGLRVCLLEDGVCADRGL
jgi:hypothetical protein